ncbi:hypothetical protein FG93_05519 [Bosea sp. LC85]|uniref:DUF2303 family protein n=1 Tax=Bosea sp. LC85 TaxID=1502851 RepID=UPI0004E38C72|nr:DUF2303 family protein [Bosea sp. LC85]KFC64009.1 hypothetical protein FG93_05519 [Bosea sp. LC85]
MAKTEPAATEALVAEAFLEGAIPNSDRGINAIVDLTRKSLSAEIINVSVPNLGPGLPTQIPVLIDRRTGEAKPAGHLIEAFRTKPAEKRGTAKALTLQSFIDLTNRHKTVHSAVFADTNWKAPSFQAVIDYHDKESAGAAENLKHRMAYSFPASEEWKAWVAQNGEPMEQGLFAAFLEDRIADLSAPTDAERIWLERDFGTTVATPAQLIQLSRGLQVNVDSVVKNIVNLATGEAQVAFEETHTDSDGKPLKVPGLFMLAIAPFFMGEKISLPVRLRYRKSGQKIVWFYQMYRPDQFVTERVRDDLITVADKTELPTFEGSPEA